MTAAFFIMLREGLEAALIVGIIAAYLVKLDRRDALRGVWIGVAAALLLSVGIGLVVFLTVGSLPLLVQDGLAGLAALLAVAVLTWMLFWMRRQGRAMKGELERGVDQALGDGGAWALAGLAFVAVAREGIETVLFLFAIGSSSGPAVSTLIAALAGLAAAAGIGYAIFAAGVRVDLRLFFNVTGVVLIFVSAGLVAFAVHEFGEAGILTNAGEAWDLGFVLPESSPFGAVIAGLFGYRAAPTPLEVIAYFAYLIPVLALFVWGGRTRTVVAASTTLVLAALLAGCGSTVTGSGTGAASRTVVAIGAHEYAFDPSAVTVPAGSVTFEVENTGTIEHEFEILKGDTVVDEVEGLVPGIARQVTATLEPGTYVFVCRLAGHEEQGMRGTLTATAG